MPTSMSTMQSLGTSWNVDDDLLNACERLVCLLYGIDHNDVSDVRYELFFDKKSPITPASSHKGCIIQALAKHLPSTCYMQIIKVESGEMHLKEWQKFQLLTGMDAH